MSEIAALAGVQRIKVSNAIGNMRARGEKVPLKSGVRRYSRQEIKPALALIRGGTSVAAAVRAINGGKDNPALHAYVSAACDADGIKRRIHPGYRK